MIPSAFKKGAALGYAQSKDPLECVYFNDEADIQTQYIADCKELGLRAPQPLGTLYNQFVHKGSKHV